MSSPTPSLTETLAASALSRQPRQGRSLASFRRMLDATKALMLERGSEDFTLQDVSDRGAVSIGSIYLRFESKDRLLHAVIAEELQAIVEKERELIEGILAQSSSLSEFMPRYVDGYSDFLSDHAQLLRTIMQRASIDPAVSEPGKETAQRSADLSAGAILTFRDEIRSKDPERRAHSVFRIVFATAARQFGLGSTAESADDAIWNTLKSELSTMALAYLQYED
ncbi:MULTISPECIES: TetR/AcrR family transcriptional regulator [unclassified Sphingomonas]|uniref:TetR/AcrR family transcriptional regulator n=1 Tax=unclassified Sphingomonas TaxID=196159 RepID=UPI0021511B00|nr:MULTISPECIES: TetR/AcrR family transcriptional regulator [unclassified Sphingomonas]MCR5872609.1 TetR/AcrR family transcriptional regulator [Sphingomonas sp. J344]UUX99104.1 TetR/AcrR family transcriptional regulator [Sphingomonas sp. J315]